MAVNKKRTTRKNLTGNRSLDTINGTGLAADLHLRDNKKRYRNLLQTEDEGDVLYASDQAMMPEGGGGGGSSTGSGDGGIVAQPLPASTPVAWPSSQAEIDSWDCATLAAKIASWQTTMVSGRFTAEGYQAYSSALQYAQTRYNSVCTMATPSQTKTPVAIAGNAQSLRLPTNSTVLDGGASTSPDDLPLSFSWQQVAGPNIAVLQNGNTARATVGYLIQGQYSFRLMVTDSNGNSDQSTVTIDVQPSPETTKPAETPQTDINPTVKPITDTAPVSGTIHEPYTLSNQPQAQPTTTAAPAEAEKVNWFIVAFAVGAVGYILFAKSE